MKRFYKDVTVAEDAAGWRVMLDGRGIRTPAGRAQVVPTSVLAEAMAGEWAGQGEEIDPVAFVLRDMADYAIDVAAENRALVLSETLPFAETDTLCYRADPEDALYRRQLAVWEPVLARAEARHGVKFERVSGIIHKPQPTATLAKLGALLDEQSPYTLAALHTLASLTASLVIALEAIEPGADAETLWTVADLEADWQAELWGQDWEAQERRARRLAAFGNAMLFARLAAV